MLPQPVLQPGRTVWRVEPCRRAAVLIDGAAFFTAVREAFLKARRSIIVVGWDIDSRTILRGVEAPSDGLPADFAGFLSALVKRRPELQIHLLLWDYSLLYANQREPLPRLSLQWQLPPQVTLCLDSSVPFGSSQHQKIVVVDDALAFSGGLDITIRRWDTAGHDVDNAARVDPAGAAYRPFHDVQMMVDGEAARALALLARRRWCHARDGEPSVELPVEPAGDPWPEGVPPDFTDVAIGIARTQPRYNGEAEVREVEMLFGAAIDRAEQAIYIENQFATSLPIAARLARRLRQIPTLEVVIVAPRSHDSFVEQRTMRNGRIRFWRLVSEAGGGRVRLVYPSIEKDGRTTDTMIHSKVMIVDDRLLRIGSANLNNRSMGADTECDLAIEAGAGPDDAALRAAILALRNRLLGEHCGVSAAGVARALQADPSLVAAADGLLAGGHRLLPIDDGSPDRSPFARLAGRIADPSRPLRLGWLLGRLLPRLLLNAAQRGTLGRLRGPGLAAAILVCVALALTLAWHFTGLASLADPERIRGILSAGRAEPWAVLEVVAAFVLGGAVAFPVTVLIVATVLVFGPWLGTLYAAAGVLASALLMFALGARFGQPPLAWLFGKRWHRVGARLRRRGLLAVVAVRVVPVAPFTLVNLAIGASSISLVDFLLGTVIGMAPGVAAMAFLGDRLAGLLAEPDAGSLSLLLLAAVAWIALSFAAQHLVSRLGDPSS